MREILKDFFTNSLLWSNCKIIFKLLSNTTHLFSWESWWTNYPKIIFLLNKVRIFSPKILNYVLILFQETYQRANGITDNTRLSDSLTWIRLSCALMCLKWKLRCKMFTADCSTELLPCLLCNYLLRLFVWFCFCNFTFSLVS